MVWLLDTCIIVDLLRRNSAAEEAVLAARDQPCYCSVSAMELIAGLRSQREESRMEAILAHMRHVPIATEAYTRAGTFLRHYRSSHGLDIPGAIIAATAEPTGLRWRPST